MWLFALMLARGEHRHRLSLWKVHRRNGYRWKAPVYQPYTPPAASVLPAPISDDAEVRRYDRYPNESDVDYIARMKQVYKTSAAELERVGAEHMLRMQQLAPH